MALPATVRQEMPKSVPRPSREYAERPGTQEAEDGGGAASASRLSLNMHACRSCGNAGGCTTGASPRAGSETPRRSSSADVSCAGFPSGICRSGTLSQASVGGGRVFTLKQLRDLIEDVYASKTRLDQKAYATQMPKETLAQHLTTYLNNRYGLKRLVDEYAYAVQHGILRYENSDADVATFGCALRCEVDEGFIAVQNQLKHTVHELLRVYIRGKHPHKTDSQISAKIVFAGAGGGTLSVLQKAGIPQVKGHALSWM